jgi:hypothetical protein
MKLFYDISRYEKTNSIHTLQRVCLALNNINENEYSKILEEVFDKDNFIYNSQKIYKVGDLIIASPQTRFFQQQTEILTLKEGIVYSVGEIVDASKRNRKHSPMSLTLGIVWNKTYGLTVENSYSYLDVIDLESIIDLFKAQNTFDIF